MLYFLDVRNDSFLIGIHFNCVFLLADVEKERVSSVTIRGSFVPEEKYSNVFLDVVWDSSPHAIPVVYTVFIFY